MINYTITVSIFNLTQTHYTRAARFWRIVETLRLIREDYYFKKLFKLLF